MKRLTPGMYDMIRTKDETGVSGTGKVAQWAVFSDGSAAVRWFGERASTVAWQRVEDAISIHIDAHPGCSRLDKHKPVESCVLPGACMGCDHESSEHPMKSIEGPFPCSAAGCGCDNYK